MIPQYNPWIILSSVLKSPDAPLPPPRFISDFCPGDSSSNDEKKSSLNSSSITTAAVSLACRRLRKLMLPKSTPVMIGILLWERGQAISKKPRNVNAILNWHQHTHFKQMSEYFTVFSESSRGASRLSTASLMSSRRLSTSGCRTFGAVIRLCSIRSPSLKVLTSHSVSAKNFELCGIHNFNGSRSVLNRKKPRPVTSTKAQQTAIVVHGRYATDVPSLCSLRIHGVIRELVKRVPWMTGYSFRYNLH